MNKVIRLYSVGYSFSTKVAFFGNKVFGRIPGGEMGRWGDWEKGRLAESRRRWCYESRSFR